MIQQGDDRILIFELKDVLEQSEGQTSVSFHLNVMVALCFHLLSKKLELIVSSLCLSEVLRECIEH